MPAPKDPTKHEEWRRKLSVAHIGLLAGEKNHNFGKYPPEETRWKISKSLTGKFAGKKSPNFGKQRSEETKRKISEANKGNLAGEKSPNFGKHRSEETRQKLSKSLTGKFAGEKNPHFGKHHSEKTRLRLSEANTLGVTEKKYCYKNRNVTPRVRAFYDHVCVLCGTPENGKAHMHHHVYYDKKACCLVSVDGTYYSKLGLKNNPSPFKIIGDPNKFVLLCNGCHGKTGGKLSNRETWARYFETMINDYYGGKSYFTAEEMQQCGKPYKWAIKPRLVKEGDKS